MAAMNSTDCSPSDLTVDDVKKLCRFLCIGTENGTYFTDNKELNQETSRCVTKLIEDGKGVDVVAEIVKCNKDGKVAKFRPIIYALALCVHVTSDVKTKQAAYKALAEVCQSPTELFTFIDIVNKMSGKGPRGWGRARRKAINGWYNKRGALTLAMDVTKYREKAKWRHIDLLRLGHVKPADKATALVLKYVSKGLEETKKEFGSDDTPQDLKDLLSYLVAVEELKHTKDEHVAGRLIEQHHLVREHLPTWLWNSKEVWMALLEDMPIVDILKNLGKMTSLGILDPLSADSKASIVIDRLKDEQLLKLSGLHPFAILLALKSYEKGKGEKGKVQWSANGAIVDAINLAFYASFKSIEPTNKRYLLAIDVSGSMEYGGVNGCPQVTPATTAACMSMVTARTEKSYEMVAFSTNIAPVKLDAKMNLEEVAEAIAEVPMGSTDCALPITWALENSKPIDVFVVYTDCDSWKGKVHPSEALKKYRKAMGVPDARLVACALTSNGFSVADSDDAGMLDVAGFDAETPGVIRNFIQGHL